MNPANPTQSERELRALYAEESLRPALCPDWCSGGCRAERRRRRIVELEASRHD